VHVCALEVRHEGADQVVPVVDLAGRQVFEPSSRRVSEVQRQVADDDLVGGCLLTVNSCIKVRL
jgi:hypothetical protein